MGGSQCLQAQGGMQLPHMNKISVQGSHGQDEKAAGGAGEQGQVNKNDSTSYNSPPAKQHITFTHVPCSSAPSRKRVHTLPTLTWVLQRRHSCRQGDEADGRCAWPLDRYPGPCAWYSQREGLCKGGQQKCDLSALGYICLGRAEHGIRAVQRFQDLRRRVPSAVECCTPVTVVLVLWHVCSKDSSLGCSKFMAACVSTDLLPQPVLLPVACRNGAGTRDCESRDAHGGCLCKAQRAQHGQHSTSLNQTLSPMRMTRSPFPTAAAAQAAAGGPRPRCSPRAARPGPLSPPRHRSNSRCATMSRRNPTDAALAQSATMAAWRAVHASCCSPTKWLLDECGSPFL